MRTKHWILAGLLAVLSSCAVRTDQLLDESAVARIRAGGTTRAEVEAMLGAPTVQRMHITQPGRGRLRRYVYERRPWSPDPNYVYQWLEVWFDDSDVVMDVDYASRLQNDCLFRDVPQ